MVDCSRLKPVRYIAVVDISPLVAHTTGASVATSIPCGSVSCHSIWRRREFTHDLVRGQHITLNEVFYAIS